MHQFSAARVAVLLAFAAALATAFAGPALAATTGLIRGTVTVDGKPAAGASLTLEGEGSRFTATADAKGDYVFSQIPFGSYRLIARHAGAHELQVLVTVQSDSVATVNVALSTNLKQIASTTVVSHGVGLQANPPSVNQLSRSTIQTSPVQNSLDKLLGTLPGVVPFSYNEPVVNGFHGVTYNIDGAPLPLATTSNFAEIVDPKNIDSLELLSGAIPAEYGGDRMGGVVNIITNRPTDIPEGFFGTIQGGFGNQSQSHRQSRHGGALRHDRGLPQRQHPKQRPGTRRPDVRSHPRQRVAERSVLALHHAAQPALDAGVRLLQPARAVSDSDQHRSEQPLRPDLHARRNRRRAARVRPLLESELHADVARRKRRLSDHSVVALDAHQLRRRPPDGRTRLHAQFRRRRRGLGRRRQRQRIRPDAQRRPSVEYVRELHRLADVRFSRNRKSRMEDRLRRQSLQLARIASLRLLLPDCADTGVHDRPYYLVASPDQAQAGSQVGIYAQDKWQLNKFVRFDYGLRYDHSTGYTGGWQLSPRAGVTVWDGGKNTVHAYYGRFYAAPLLEDVRQDCVVLQGCPTTPVYNLQPERDAYFEIGAEHFFNPSFSGAVNIFRKTAVNILDTTQLLNTPLFAVFNNAIGIDSGVELRLTDTMPNLNQWFFTATISGSYAACVSGSTFLFPPDTNPPNQSCVSQLAPEDHDETIASTAAYTWRFGRGHQWFTTLQGNYGSGFPVQFESANANLSGRLPAHTTFDVSAGRYLTPGRANDHGLGLSFIVTNVLNHQYPIKVANGFNTTQIANGTSVLFRLSAPF